MSNGPPNQLFTLLRQELVGFFSILYLREIFRKSSITCANKKEKLKTFFNKLTRRVVERHFITLWKTVKLKW
jgi:hypothetical protein